LLVDSWSITSLAAEVIVDWPGAFHRLLAWNQARNDDPRALHLRRRLGRLYHHIYVTLRDPRYEFIRAELENYLTTHWPAVTGGNRKRTQHLSDTRWSWWPMMRACKSLGVSRAVLRDLIDRGVLEADRRITERGRKRVFVRGVRLNGEPLSDSFVTCKAAAKTLGLNNARLRAMIPTLFPKAWKGSDFVWRIPTIEVDALCHVGCRMAPASESGSSLVTLAHALQYLRLSNSSLAQIVTQAKDHVKHRPVGKQSPHRGLRSWIFERSYIENIIRNSSTPTADGQSRMLSVRQLAHRWDIRRQTMYKFLTSGALAILALPRGAGGERLIAIEEIESFERRYVFAMEITKRLGCTCKRLMHALRVRGIEAANAKRKAGRVVFERTPELENAVAEIALMLAERTNDVTLKQETPHGRFPPPTMQASTTRQNLH
jgi:hypothetical protein